MNRLLRFIPVAILILVVPVSLFAKGSREEVTPSRQERIAIVSAYGPEILKLKAEADIEDEIVINGKSFTLCRIEGKEAVLFLSGVSMVNAAMTTQLALDTFNIKAILFSGIAQGVNPDLNIGDVVVPARWTQYRAVEVTHGRLDEVDSTESKFWFDVDPDLLTVAQSISDVKLISEKDGAVLHHTPKLIVGGSGVSGSTFADNADNRNGALETFHADCLDMESAAVAHVAYVSDVPFIAFRSISDRTGGGADENAIGTFFSLAADNAAEVLTDFLKAWK